MSQVLSVDDQSSNVVYTGSWIHALSTPNVEPQEFDHTKSGTSQAGATAKFTFTGTQVTVFGSQGSVDVYGQPTTTYTIDGVTVGRYTTPVIQPGFFTALTQFFQSDTLSAGEHTLVITNVNGTSPNVFWLDYIQYISSPVSTNQPSSPTSS
ncbi:hypothetical protein C8Q75DRAFT_696081, partial [Abortiporus biennis]